MRVRECIRFINAPYGGPIWLRQHGKSNSGNIYGVTAADGKQLWRYKTGTSTYTSPHLSGGLVYCGTDDGNLYALEGGATAPARDTEVRRAVFWEDVPGFKRFRTGSDVWIREYFKPEDYEQVDGGALAAFMTLQVERGGRSVVVFAENRVPRSALNEETPRSLFGFRETPQPT
jgi:hypothetical protein